MNTAFLVRTRDNKPFFSVLVSSQGSKFTPLTENAKELVSALVDEYEDSPIPKSELAVSLDRGMTIDGPMPQNLLPAAIEKAKAEASESQEQEKMLPIVSISDTPISVFSTEEAKSIIAYKASAFISERHKTTFNYEVKRVRAMWDPNLSIPGTNRRGGWRCPVGTRYGGQITDRFGRNCGWGVARRIANAITNIGERLENIDDGRRGRRVNRRNERMVNRLQNAERGAGRLERGLRGVAERLEGRDDDRSTEVVNPPRRPRGANAGRRNRVERVVEQPAAPARRRRQSRGNLRPSEQRRMQREIVQPGAPRTDENAPRVDAPEAQPVQPTPRPRRQRRRVASEQRAERVATQRPNADAVPDAGAQPPKPAPRKRIKATDLLSDIPERGNAANEEKVRKFVEGLPMSEDRRSVVLQRLRGLDGRLNEIESRVIGVVGQYGEDRIPLLNQQRDADLNRMTGRSGDRRSALNRIADLINNQPDNDQRKEQIGLLAELVVLRNEEYEIARINYNERTNRINRLIRERDERRNAPKPQAPKAPKEPQAPNAPEPPTVPNAPQVNAGGVKPKAFAAAEIKGIDKKEIDEIKGFVNRIQDEQLRAKAFAWVDGLDGQHLKGVHSANRAMQRSLLRVLASINANATNQEIADRVNQNLRLAIPQNENQILERITQLKDRIKNSPQNENVLQFLASLSSEYGNLAQYRAYQSRKDDLIAAVRFAQQRPDFKLDEKAAKLGQGVADNIKNVIGDGIVRRKKKIGEYLRQRHGDGDLPWKDMTPEAFRMLQPSEQQAYIKNLYQHDKILGENGKLYNAVASVRGSGSSFSVEVNFNEIDSNGRILRKVGSSSRSITLNNKQVYNGTLFITNDADKNNGIATIYNNYAFMGLQAIGVTKAKVTAAQDGQFVWAKVGYKPRSAFPVESFLEEVRFYEKFGGGGLIRNDQEYALVRKLLTKPRVSHQEMIFAVSGSGKDKVRDAQVKGWFLANAPIGGGILTFAREKVESDPRRLLRTSLTPVRRRNRRVRA
jgi:hypothetical protein